MKSTGLALAPVTITPTKPLTPTHVKGLLSVDLIYKSTSALTEITYVWNARAANLTAQTVAFWAYVDRVAPGVDWSQCTEAEIDELYVRSHAEPARPAFAVLRPYLERVEAEGWIHPASRRLLDLWAEQLRLLGVGDPGLTAVRPLALGTGDALDLLARRGLLVDHRRFGGPAYLDGTAWGLPLRQLVSDDGQVNYLLPVLRDLVALIGRCETFLLVFDRELSPDYVLLDRVLTTLGRGWCGCRWGGYRSTGWCARVGTAAGTGGHWPNCPGPAWNTSTWPRTGWACGCTSSPTVNGV